GLPRPAGQRDGESRRRGACARGRRDGPRRAADEAQVLSRPAGVHAARAGRDARPGVRAASIAGWAFGFRLSTKTKSPPAVAEGLYRIRKLRKLPIAALAALAAQLVAEHVAEAGARPALLLAHVLAVVVALVQRGLDAEGDLALVRVH